jgi:Secretion system C-terminal sorting domain
MKHFVSYVVMIWSVLPMVGQTFNNRYSFPLYSSGVGASVEEIDGKYHIYSNIGDSLYKYAIHVIDIDGEVLDSAKFYSDSVAVFNGYSNTSDAYLGGVVSAGTVNYGNGLKNGLIIKWDNSADTLATKKIFPTADYSVVILQQAKAVSDGFVAIGSISDGAAIEKILLVKTDFELNEVWRMEYGSSAAPHAGYSVEQTPDGGFLIGGVRKVPDSWDHVVIKTHSDGTQQFLRYYGNDYKCYYAMVSNSLDGNYYFGGRLQISENDDFSQVCKLDTDLDTIWCKVFGNYGPDCRVNSLKLLPDGNLIVCGMDRSNFTMFGYILKIDSDGNEIWYRKYAQTHGNWCFFQDVIATSDGGYFLTGSLFPEIDLTQDIWGMKLDDMGCLVPGCDTLTSVNNVNELVGFSVYPNPATELLNIYVSIPVNTGSRNAFDGSVFFELVDIFGSVVKSFSPEITDTTYMLDVADLPAGVYLLNLLFEGEFVRSEKLMKN